MPGGAFARDLVLGPPAMLRLLWLCAAILAVVVEAWLLLVAPGFAAVGALLIGFAVTMRWRAVVRAESISGLIHSADGHWYGECSQGMRVELKACNTVVLPQAVFARFRCGATPEFGLALTRGAVRTEDFRRLQVLLRHSARAGNRRN